MTTAMPPGLEMTTARPRSSGFGDKERDRESKRRERERERERNDDGELTTMKEEVEGC